LVQSGKSDRETQSTGSHGGMGCPPVSPSLLGNFHPTPAIEMIRGERGDHGCQAKARLIVVTGTPVQPHELYGAVGEVEPRANWVPVPPEIHSEVGLGTACRSAREFRTVFAGGADGDDSSEGEAEQAPYVPSRDGYPHVLPDGVEVSVRLTLTCGRYQVEWRIPDRKVDIQADRNIAAKMPEFSRLSAVVPHRKISLTPAARGAFLSYQTMLQRQSEEGEGCP